MAGGLLGYAASMGQGINSLADWLEERARFAGGRVKRLATDPVGLLGTMAGEAGKSFTDFADAAARGDMQATVEGLLNSGLAGPLTFAGVGAKTADKVALQKAKQMANVGEDPVKIWQTTGWTEQFPDKKWRFEIPDTRAGWIADPAVAGGGKAAKEFAHPDVYAAYPELKNVDVWRSSGLEPGAGQYSPPGATKFGEISVGAGYGSPKLSGLPKSVAIHEFQHPIQQREGFARGGSPMSLQGQVDAVNKWLDAAKKSKDPEEVAAIKAYLQKFVDLNPYEQYRRLAGEAEARLTQARMNLTPAERMQHPPWLPGPYGFDVPPEQQIVRGLLGEQTGPAMQTVYHGTPHTWQPEPGFPQGRFRLDKLGTGEGAAAYGPGAYWAEAQTTGETYRHSLSDHAIEIGGRKINPERGSIEDRAAAWVQGAVDAQSSEGPFQYAKKQVRSILGKSSSVADDIVKQIEKWQEQGATVGKGGNLYKTDLPDEVLPKMLQWDKPLSEQPESVRKAVKQLVAKAKEDAADPNALYGMATWSDRTARRIAPENIDQMDGAAIYEMLQKVYGNSAGTELTARGIPGLSYLDAGSRAGPINPISGGYYANKKRTMNHVVWDQELLNRMKPEPVGGLLGQQ